MSDSAMEKVKAYFSQGNQFYSQGNAQQAVESYRQALAIQPDIPEVLANMGAALQALGQSAEAQKTLLHCLRLRPAYADALNTLGHTYKSLGDTMGASLAYLNACSVQPNHLAAWLNLGQILHQTKDYAGAIVAYEKALLLDPGHIKALGELTSMLHLLCRWDALPAVVEQMKEAIRSGHYTEPFVGALYAPELELENTKGYTALHFAKGKPYDAAFALPSTKRKGGTLHIGYLSCDFYRHATAHLISELFENHDRAQFKIHAYSYGIDDKSEARARIMQGLDVFRDIRTLDDAVAAELIRKDGIDILVELKGYTLDHRQSLMALRPAPLQMHYLGYPGTIGAPFIDYFIADTITVPAEADALFSEKLIRLPHSYQINDRKRPLPAKPRPRATYGLPEKAFVFCAFNQSFKVTPEMYAVWMRLLQTIDGSVLWLYETHPEASANLFHEAEKHGVDAERIIIAGKVTPEEHLSRTVHADLFLDTFPCNAHTTASDMLWCAVPMVTMTGPKFISRVAASLLHAVGLSDLVTENLSQYEALALSLARDKALLKALRAHLEKGRMQFPLFDSIATTRALEAAYMYAAAQHAGHKLPSEFSVADDLKIS